MSFSQKQHKDNLEDWASSTEFRKKGVTSYGFNRPETQPTKEVMAVMSMMPFNRKLYVATGYAGGIYAITEDFVLEEVEISDEAAGNNFGRVWHEATNKALVGHNIIDENEDITHISPVGHGAASECPSFIDDPSRYILATAGSEVHKVDMENGTTSLLTDLGYSIPWQGLDFRERDDYLFAVSKSTDAAGRGIWRYDGTSWTRVFDEWFTTAYHAATASKWCPLYFAGWDEKSAILRVTTDSVNFDTYRFPISAPGINYWRRMPWRMRMTQGFITLADIAGILYQLQFEYNPAAGLGQLGGLRPKPISRHNQRIFEFSIWQGLIGFGREDLYPQATGGGSGDTGFPNTGLDFYREEDLWNWGDLKGYGGVWKNTSVGAGETSDPFLINGFDQKTIHLETDAATDYTIQVDPIGDGSWKNYDTVSFSGAGYDAYIMTGDAVWVRVKSSNAVTATIWLNVE